ncbi:filamentous hemagglutinin [Arundinibacter roseus]|uniref:Filamentous hemagglutinin n=1 Tax=Arundinibacter roseus TaxID=2070510 RepID=A0A4R4KNB2_9BACT|nr:filamentous hemagglutinin [Arundinibacter roseus]TDB68219.1 filamentous hemagglutinin [Arundinibacter roseus]
MSTQTNIGPDEIGSPQNPVENPILPNQPEIPEPIAPEENPPIIPPEPETPPFDPVPEYEPVDPGIPELDPDPLPGQYLDEPLL